MTNATTVTTDISYLRRPEVASPGRVWTPLLRRISALSARSNKNVKCFPSLMQRRGPTGFEPNSVFGYNIVHNKNKVIDRGYFPASESVSEGVSTARFRRLPSVLSKKRATTFFSDTHCKGQL